MLKLCCLYILFLIMFPSAAKAALSLSVISSDGSSSLRLDGEGEGGPRREVRIRVSSTDDGQYQVFQRLVEPLFNERGQPLPSGMVQTASVPHSSTGGTLYLQSPEPLGMGQQLVFSSGPGGASDSFVLSYLVDPAGSVNGLYSGRIEYSVRGPGAPAGDRAVINVTLDASAGASQRAPEFRIEVVEPAGGVSFPKVLPTNNVDEREVTVRVHTNRNRPYQIVQTLSTPLTNEKGEEISKDGCLFKVELPPDQQGSTPYADFTSLDAGNRPIYRSDPSGGPVELKVIYRMQGSKDLPTGHFLSMIKMSLNEL